MKSRRSVTEKFKSLVRQIIKEELSAAEVKVGSTYTATMPTPDGSKTVDVKVKVLGPYKAWGPEYFMVEILQDAIYTLSGGAKGAFMKGNQHAIEAKFLK